MEALADHLWQSTWFALAAGLLASFVRRDAAKLRFWLWFVASIKFLFPFALLSWVGNQFSWQVEDEQALLPIVQQVAAPLTTARIPIDLGGGELARLLVGGWALVATLLLGRLFSSWLHSRALVRWSVVCDVAAPIPVRSSDRITEPGVVGIVNQTLLLPGNLLHVLSPEQLQAVIAHEMWHVRRRDNLTSVLHAVIQALFWFHPLVWWIGAKLAHEREHACDEGAVEDGSDPRIYAETLLRVGRYSIEARTTCIARATGGNLGARIRRIMLLETVRQAGAARRVVLGAVMLTCTALPVASGMTIVVTSSVSVRAGTESIRVSDMAGPSVIVMHDDYIYARNATLRELIARAYSVAVSDVAGNVRALDTPRFDIELGVAAAAGIDHRQLIADLLDQQFNVELIARPTALHSVR